jgi:pectate lyase
MARRGPGIDPRAALAVALGLALEACGTDVAQTATVVPQAAPSGLDCTPPTTTPTLPSDPQLGGDAKRMPWVLQSGDYVADQGPGVVVAARDGFRLFVNGHLLEESTASLEPVFVPLTLMPGENAVSVVVTASAGAPALLALVDELERPYPSDASWKVSATPSGDWSAAGYDDSTWANATDRGAPEANPGCDPGPGFPKGSGAAWLSAPSDGTAVFRKELSITPVGFAAGTTGGGSAEPLLVETMVPQSEVEATVDTLAAALKADGPAVIVLGEGSLDVHRTGDDVTETSACPVPCPDEPGKSTKNLLPDDDPPCAVTEVQVERSERRFEVGSDKTIVGLGRGAQLYGGSLNIGDSKNVIVRNVALYGVNPALIEAGDGISLDEADGVWIDHVTFEAISDGFIDSTTGSKNLTFSWVKNNGHNVFACGDKHPRSNELADTTATIHHTLWQQVAGRAPFARGDAARVHLFSNVVIDADTYAVGSGCDAQVLVEATSFETVAAPTSKQTCTDTTALGLIRAASNQYVDVGPHLAGDLPATEPHDEQVFTPSYDYAQAVDSADTARFIVPQRAGTGSRWALPLDYP